MKAITLFLIIACNVTLASAQSYNSITFNELLEKCNVVLKKSDNKYNIAFDWEKEVLAFTSKKCNFSVALSENLAVSKGEFSEKLVGISYKDATPIEKFCADSDKPKLYTNGLGVWFNNNSNRNNFSNDMQQMIKLYNRGKTEVNWVSGEMTFDLISLEISKNAGRVYQMKKDYQKTMNAILTEMVLDYPNIKLRNNNTDKLFKVTYEVPDYAFPYSKTILEHNQGTDTRVFKVRRKDNEPINNLVYWELIENSVTFGDFYFTRTEEESALLQGYYPIKSHSTGEIVAFYNVALDDSGFDLYDYRTSKIANQFGKVLQAFATTNVTNTDNADLLLPGSVNYINDEFSGSNIITQTYGPEGYIMIETITGSNQYYFKSLLPKGVTLIKGFKRRVRDYSYHDIYAYLFDVNGKKIFMGIDVDNENDNEIMTVSFFKGRDDYYVELIENKERIDQEERERVEAKKQMEKFMKSLPMFGVEESVNTFIKEKGYTILATEKFDETPNNQNLKFHYTTPQLKNYVSVMIVIVFDVEDYFWGYPTIYCHGYRTGNLNTSTANKFQKTKGKGGAKNIMRHSTGFGFDAGSMKYVEMGVTNFTKGTYYILAK